MGRLNRLGKLGVPKDVLTNHGPQVRTLCDTPERLETTLVIFIVIFAERDLGPFHFLLFLDEPFDNVTVFGRCHGQIKHIDVIMVQNLDAIFDVSRFRCVCRKLKIGVGPPF